MIPIVFDVEEGAMDRCPKRPLLDYPEFFYEIFTAHAWAEKGFLPDPGTWKDQGAALMPYLLILSKASSDAQEEKDKSAKRKAARESRAPKARSR